MSYQLQILDMVKTFSDVKGKPMSHALTQYSYLEYTKTSKTKTKTYIGECIMHMYGAVKMI